MRRGPVRAAGAFPAGRVRVEVNLSRYAIGIVRYASYALSGDAYVSITPSGTGTVSVELSPKSAGAGGDLAARLKKELAEEKFRAEAFERGRPFMAALVARSLSRSSAPSGGRAPTPAQKKELDDLIARMEAEAAAGKKGGGKKR